MTENELNQVYEEQVARADGTSYHSKLEEKERAERMDRLFGTGKKNEVRKDDDLEAYQTVEEGSTSDTSEAELEAAHDGNSNAKKSDVSQEGLLSSDDSSDDNEVDEEGKKRKLIRSVRKIIDKVEKSEMEKL